MIHYHGTPITPERVAEAVLTRRHAFVSFARPDQIAFVAEACQSFAIDNGAFSFWRQNGGGRVDMPAYAKFVGEWAGHPGFDWCVIPDAIDGDEQENGELIREWNSITGLRFKWQSVPVWHLHESVDRLERLSRMYARVALGSSGEYSDPGSPAWWHRMGEAMDAICDGDGYPPCKLHGLRMLNPTIFSQFPLASADSTNIAQNHSRADLPLGLGALIIARRVEEHACARRWTKSYGTQQNFDLVG